MPNPEWDATTWDLSRYIPKEHFTSTNKALRAILGYSGKRFCSTTDFESVPIQPGIPQYADPDLRHWLQYECGKDIEVWAVRLEDLKAFPFASKTMVREAYVPAAVASLFRSDRPFPHDQWPEAVPFGYSAASSHGVLVKWTETYSEAAGAEFFEAMEGLDGMSGELRLVCVVG